MKKIKENKGITLIALIITIIILLILAGVTIAMLTGENGILNKVNNAKTENTVGKEKEEIGLAYTMAVSDNILDNKIIDKKVSANQLNINMTYNKVEELKNIIQKEKKIIVEYNNGHIYEITENGTIIKIENIGEEETPKVSDTTPGELAGTGTKDDPYLIESIEDLVGFSNKSATGITYENKYITLNLTLDFENDNSYSNPKRTNYGDINGDGIIEELKIELTKRTGRTTGEYQEGFISISEFNGTFEGNYKTIKNLYQKINKEIVSGLFKNIVGGKILNLSLTGEIYIERGYEAGSFAGTMWANSNFDMPEITNCNNYVNITAPKNAVGGIVGTTESNYESLIKNCTNYGNIIGGERTGGIAGKVAGTTFENCINNGNIESTKDYIGGIMTGFDGAILKNCINKGNITGNNYIAGIVAYSGGGSGTPSFDGKNINYGTITGKETVGGIIGSFYLIETSQNNTLENRGNIIGENNVGGIIGTCSDFVSAVNIVNTGNITGKTNVAGLIGNIMYDTWGNLTNSYNTGNIIGEINVGGIIGLTSNGCILKNVYNKGNIKGNTNVGALLGKMTSENNYVVDLKNVYNIGTAEENKLKGKLFGLLSVGEGITAAISNCYYLPETVSGVSNGLEIPEIVVKNFTPNELLIVLNEGVKYYNKWKIDSSKNNGYPIFENQ